MGKKIVRWIHLFSLLTYLLTLHTTNRHRQSKFTMLLSLNYFGAGARGPAPVVATAFFPLINLPNFILASLS